MAYYIISADKSVAKAFADTLIEAKAENSLLLCLPEFDR